MISFGSETILISDISDGVDDAIRSSVGVASLHHLSLFLGSRILNITLLLHRDSVRCRNAVQMIIRKICILISKFRVQFRWRSRLRIVVDDEIFLDMGWCHARYHKNVDWSYLLMYELSIGFKSNTCLSATASASKLRAAAGWALLLKRCAVAQANAIDKTICDERITVIKFESKRKWKGQKAFCFAFEVWIYRNSMQ